MNHFTPMAASDPVALSPLSAQTLVRSVTTSTDVSAGVKCTRVVFRDGDDVALAAIDVPEPLLPELIEHLLRAIKMRPVWSEVVS